MNESIHYPILHGSELFTNEQRISVTLSSAVPEYLGVVHSHDFIEIVYVISGRAKQITDKQTSFVSKGDLIILNFQTPHAFVAEENPQDPFLAYDLGFNPDFLDDSLAACSYFEDIHASFLLSSLQPSSAVVPCINLSGSVFDDFSRLYQNMHREFCEKKLGYVDVIRAGLVELIIKIYRKLDEDSVNSPTVSKDHLVNSILDYIHAKYNEPIKLEDISRGVFLSQGYLNKLLKSITGKTFGAYLQDYRLEMACKMLVETDEPVECIHAKCGFPDSKNFYVFFKRKYGLPPGEYRRENQRGAFPNG